MVNVYLIKIDKGSIFVDIGIFGFECKIECVLYKYGLSFKDIKFIVVIYVYIDYVGSVVCICELFGVLILVYQDDIDYYSCKVLMIYCIIGWVGKFFVKMLVLYEFYVGFVLDFLMKDVEIILLKDFGVDGIVCYIVGYMLGLIGIELVLQDVLVGDLIVLGILIGGIVFNGYVICLLFEDDLQIVVCEFEWFVNSGVKCFYMGYGGLLEVLEVLCYVKVLVKLYLLQCVCGQYVYVL